MCKTYQFDRSLYDKDVQTSSRFLFTPIALMPSCCQSAISRCFESWIYKAIHLRRTAVRMSTAEAMTYVTTIHLNDVIRS
jgi:hypothetical protein